MILSRDEFGSLDFSSMLLGRLSSHAESTSLITESILFRSKTSAIPIFKKENFLLHLQKTEFRHNTKIKQQDLYKILLKLIRNNPLKLS